MTNNADSDKSSKSVDNSNPFSYGSEIVQRIPLIGEKFTLTKQTKEGQVSIEKRWTTADKKNRDTRKIRRNLHGWKED